MFDEGSFGEEKVAGEAGGHAKPFPWLSPAPPADLPLALRNAILFPTKYEVLYIPLDCMIA